MKTKNLIRWPLIAGLAALLCAVGSGSQVPVNLRSAGNFVILSKSGITNVPASAVVGNIGTSPITGAAITGLGRGEVSGQVCTVDAAGPAFRVTLPALLTAAVRDMEAAYTNAAGRVLPDFTELGAGNVDGMTLHPGLYKWGTSVLIPTGVTLDAQGKPNAVWIFQIAQKLKVGNGAIVTLTGGAQAKNIFWQVAGQATLGTTSDFKGIILCATAIALQTGASLDGRALAQTAVTLQTNDISSPAN
jgi:Ice-binding-like